MTRQEMQAAESRAASRAVAARMPGAFKPSATEAKILLLQERLETWNSFVRELQVPSDIAPAFLTRRVELMSLAKPRPLTESECKVMYDLVAGLLETNEALREHAALVAELAQQFTGGLAGTLRAADRMRAFANFHEPVEEPVESAPRKDPHQ